MNDMYDIACQDCRVSLLVGQLSRGKHHIYQDNVKTKVTLSDFLFNHKGHVLVYDDSERFLDYPSLDE